MHQTLYQFNHNLSLLAEEYCRLISLSTLSEDEADCMAEILDMASKDESLNCLIEEIEMNDYENQGLQNLFQTISEDIK